MIGQLFESRRVRTLLQILGLAAAVVWILFAFQSYLPAVFSTQFLSVLSWAKQVERMMRRSGAYDLFLAVWFAGVAYCLGRRLLRKIGVTAAAGAEETIFSIASGAMLFSWSMFILSLVHGLYRPVAYALLLIPTVAFWRELKRLPVRVWEALAKNVKSLSGAKGIGIKFLAVYVLMALGVILISALAPSFEYDDLVYHLTGPKNFVLAHKLVGLQDVPLIYFPKNIEMLHTLGMLLHCDIVAKLMVFLYGCLTMIGVYGFLARFVSRVTGMIAVTVLASSPLFIWEMRTAHNDIGLTLFLFAGMYACILWLRTREQSWFRLACLFLAFSLGVKYWAILMTGIVVALVFIAVLLQSRSWRPAVHSAFKLGFYSSLGLVPWALLCLHYTGNPLFPLLNNIFKSPYWTSGHTTMAMGEMFQGGIEITFANLWDLLRLPWEMMVDPHSRFGGNVGPWYVIFIPFLLFFPSMGVELTLLFAGGLLYYTGWAVSGPWARFLLPALPGLAAATAFAIVRLLRFLGSLRQSLAVIAGVGLAVLAMLASPYFEEKGSWSRYGNSPIFTLPIKYLSGNESKDDYLNRFYPEYKAVKYLNQIPGEKKVLYVHTLPDGFYLNGKAAFHYSPYLPGLVGADADRIHRVLRQNGITHIVVSQPNQESSPLSSRESDFTHRYLKKLYQMNASIVYELLPSRIDQVAVMYDFMDHLDETSAKRIKPGDPGSAYKGIRAKEDDRRYTLITVPPSKVEYHLTVPDQATLSFAAAREDPGYTGKGFIQVWISTSEKDRHLIYSCELAGNVRNWIENRVDLGKYAGRHVKISFQAEETSPCCNYFLADPVLMAPTNAIELLEVREQLAHGQVGAPIVLGGKAMPDRVKIGKEFEMSFSGKGLTSELYFDVRFLAPDSTVEQTALNWQYGTSLLHTIAPGTAIGKYIITGVRAHYHTAYRNGEFNPVHIPFEVIP